MNKMSRIMHLETPMDSKLWTDPRYHIFSIYANSLDDYKLLWAAQPEGIVQMAMKNLNIPVCKDETGKEWDGTHLLYFINNCKLENRYYNQIGMVF